MRDGFQEVLEVVVLVALMLVSAVFASGGSLGAEPIDAIVSEMERLGFEPIPGQESLEVPFESAGRRGRHVIGILPATEDGAAGSAAILLGARIDENAGLIAAGKIAENSRRHPVIVAFWSGEASPAVDIPGGHLLACIELANVEPVSSNRLEVLGVDSSPVWRGLVERSNVPVGFDISVENRPAVTESSVPFSPAAVPAITLRTGSAGHPSGLPAEMSRQDPEHAGRVAQFSALLVRRLDGLDEPPEYVAIHRAPDEPHTKRQSAYTGTIPDYTAEVEGLLLSGVMQDGPAEQAGLAEGDVIVEFAGEPIKDIYGYRDALESVEVGRPIQVVFIRDGERREVTLVPTTRP